MLKITEQRFFGVLFAGFGRGGGVGFGWTQNSGEPDRGGERSDRKTQQGQAGCFSAGTAHAELDGLDRLLERGF